jgi:hypothetical protein
MGRGIVGALAGGILGAVIWGVLAAVTGMEFGLVAWGIGGLVGGGAVMLGGGGKELAIACGLIAALSIVGGKFAMSVFVLDSDLEEVLREQLEAEFTTELHAEFNADAVAFMELAGQHEYADFMYRHQYSDTEYVTPAEIRSFEAGMAHLLRRWAVSPQPFPQARQEYVNHLLPLVHADVRQEITHVDVVKESFGFLDIVFFALGVITAYSIVARREDEEPPVFNHGPAYNHNPDYSAPPPPQPPHGQRPQQRSGGPPPPPWEQPKQ